MNIKTLWFLGLVALAIGLCYTYDVLSGSHNAIGQNCTIHIFNAKKVVLARTNLFTGWRVNATVLAEDVGSITIMWKNHTVVLNDSGVYIDGRKM